MRAGMRAMRFRTIELKRTMCWPAWCTHYKDAGAADLLGHGGRAGAAPDGRCEVRVAWHAQRPVLPLRLREVAGAEVQSHLRSYQCRKMCSH